MVEFEESGWLYAVREWHVVFLAGPRRRWWDWICDKEFRHVLAFGWHSVANVWVVVDSRQDGLRVRLVPDGREFINELTVWKHTGMKCLRCEAQGSTDIRHRIGFWCVPVVKNLIGQGGGALRPQALYRILLRNGATPSFTDGDAGGQG